MARTYAGILGLVGMSTVLLRALKSGSAGGAAGAALAWLAILAAVGWFVGAIAETTIVESVRRRLEDELAARDEKGISNNPRS